MGIVEMVVDRARMEGEKRGMERKNHDVIINMLSKNLPNEMIADIAEVSLEHVQKVRKSLAGN